MVNYKNGKIYCIKGGNECYVGSTTSTLSNRYTGHKKNYKKWLICGKRYTSSHDLFKKYGADNCSIELLEIFPCDNKKELRIRENYYIHSMDNIVNKYNSYTSPEEKKKKQLEYRQNNREILRNKTRKYRQSKEVQLQEKEYSDKYININKDKLKLQKKIWYQKNKDRINKRKREIYTKQQEEQQ